MKTVKAIIERSADGHFSIYMDDNSLPYLVTGTGKTVAEARAVFMGGYEDMKRIFTEDGNEFEEVTFEFHYDMASFLQFFAYALTLAGLERITGVNQRQLSHYINGTSKPSKQTTKKIEEGLHSFANEITAVKFV
ncbi:MAG: helix-turn-helix transcriptional regulator [Alistipes sp.]|nr:helix-turn-helix transcriptional regulator [Alistipes sp.]